MTQTTEQPPQPQPQPSPQPSPSTEAGPEKAWPRVASLVGVLVGAVVLSLLTGTFPAVAFVLALIASVMLHETGHFITAKKAGMKVTEYFFGFGPRLWSVKRGETEYGVKAIPAGGYVKIVGMSNVEKDIDPADEPRTYRQQSYPKKLMVAVAGIVTHFIIAFLLLVLAWTVVGVPRATLHIGSISRLASGPSPAQQAGFQLGDKIVAVDGRPVSRWDELPPYIRARPGQRITFTVDRKGERLALEATPANGNPDGEQVGFIGIGSHVAGEKVNPVVAVGRSAHDVGTLTVGSVKALGSFFAPGSLKNYGNQLTGTSKTNSESRPISVVGVTRIANQASMFDFFALLIMLNIFVAVFNAVPLPPLDGGHIAIATYERIRSRPGRRYQADVQKLLPLTAAVVLILVTLGATTVILDIVRPIANPLR